MDIFTAALITASLLNAQTAAQTAAPPVEGWTWALYEGQGRTTFVEEVPDTPHLRTTLECTPGAAAARLTIYDSDLAPGFAVVSSGAAQTTTEAETAQNRYHLALRMDQPLFAAFQTSGRLQIVSGDTRQSILIAPQHLAKLRRFAELCGE